jgi:hypothetical protein
MKKIYRKNIFIFERVSYTTCIIYKKILSMTKVKKARHQRDEHCIYIKFNQLFNFICGIFKKKNVHSVKA